MITEKVYSPIKDNALKANLKTSPIWKTCYKEEDLNRDILMKHERMYVYTIKFDGVTPVQLSGVTEMGVKEKSLIM